MIQSRIERGSAQLLRLGTLVRVSDQCFGTVICNNPSHEIGSVAEKV